MWFTLALNRRDQISHLIVGRICVGGALVNQAGEISQLVNKLKQLEKGDSNYFFLL